LLQSDVRERWDNTEFSNMDICGGEVRAIWLYNRAWSHILMCQWGGKRVCEITLKIFECERVKSSMWVSGIGCFTN
jgi:hypothetical protein